MITDCEKAHRIYTQASNKLGAHEIAVLREVMETGQGPTEIKRTENRHELRDHPFEALCTEFAHLLK